MFVNGNDNNGLVFIRSENINVFPCGRRKSELVDMDGNSNTVSDKYYIPFDPEARLNTEANNRKHTSLNGYKQNYFNYLETRNNGGNLSFTIAGYLFNIQLTQAFNDSASFGVAVETLLNTTADTLYANIKLATVTFFQSKDKNIPAASTEVLRDQSTSIEPIDCLDILETGKDRTKASNYYFSGLSFSAADRSADGCISVPIMKKVDNSWVINEEFKLPRIDHGATTDSIVMYGDLDVAGTINATTINTQVVNADTVNLTNGKAAVIKLKNKGNDRYQLEFFI